MTERIEREAASLGLATVRGADTTGCSTAAAARAATTEDVWLVLCTNGSVVLVWSVSPKGVHLDDVLLPPEQGAPMATVAMRAAEVARVKIAAVLERPSLQASRYPERFLTVRRTRCSNRTGMTTPGR
jgi:hypothetical protein